MVKAQTEKHLAWLLLVILLLNILDFLATQDLVVNGIHSEWNPLMRVAIRQGQFSLYKLVLIPLGLLFLWIMREIVLVKYLNLVRLTCAIYGTLILYTWLLFYA